MCIYDVYGPCSCPHGRCFTILTQFFAVGSWVTSMMALTSCFYMSVRPIPEEGAPEMPKEGFGWISRQIEVQEPPAYGKQCAWYTAEERALYFDSMWNAGMAMAILTVIMGLVVMSTVLCTCCVAFQLPTFEGLFWTCVFCFVAQCLTFLSWGSELCDEMECTWSSGTGMNLTAAMMWVWAANMIKSFPEALPPRTRGNRRVGENTDREEDDGDVYLSNRNNNPDSDGLYRDDEYGDWDNDNSKDNGDGYYDENGDWVDNNPNNHYSDNDNDNDNYDSYDDYDNNSNHNKSNNAGYSDYDNESSSNWAEESDDNFDENEPLPKTKSKRKPKRIPRKKRRDEDGNEIPSSSLSSFDNDDWDDERGSFRYS